MKSMSRVFCNRKKDILFLLFFTFIQFDCIAVASSYHAIRILSGTDNYHKSISCSTKDYQGFIWFISGGLLYRYDGIKSVAFSQLFTKKAQFTEVKKVVADPWGRLWISSRNGLFVFDTKKWDFLPGNEIAKGIYKKDIVSFLTRGDCVFVATATGEMWQIFKTNKKLLFRFSVQTSELRTPIGQLLVADSNTLWFAHAQRLYQLDLHSYYCKVTTIPMLIFKKLDDLLILNNGVLLRNFDLGYLTYDGNRFKPCKLAGISIEKSKNWAHFSLADPDKGRVVFFFRDGAYKEYTNTTGLQLQYSGQHTIAEDFFRGRMNDKELNGSEWILSTENGLYSIASPSLDFEFWKSGSARGIIRQGNSYYLGGYGPLKSFDVKDDTKQIREISPLNNYYSFLRLSPDSLLIALEGDFLGYLVNGKFSFAPYHVSKKYKEQLSGMVYCMETYQNNIVLLGTYNGIWCYDRISHEVSPLLDGEGKAFTNKQRIQSLTWQNGKLSYTNEDGYFEFLDNHLTKIFPVGNEKLNIYAHCFHKGSTYLATKGQGLIRIKDKNHQQYTVENGLASNTIFSMKWIGDNLFLGTYSGLSIFTHNGLYSAFHTSGLPFEEFNHNAIYWDETSKKLFMGGLEGYVEFDPSTIVRSIEQQSAPKLTLAALHLGKNSNVFVNNYASDDLQDTIYIPHNAIVATLDFAQNDAYKTRYKSLFRILPLMKTFQELPLSGEINLSGLNSGEYTIQVQTKLLNGQSKNIKTWILFKKPHFYETQLFYALVLLSIGLTIFLILTGRARQHRNERSLRRKLARDLHDEVGGLLTGISMQTDLLSASQGFETKKGVIQTIADYSQEAILMMDDIIWSIDTRNNTEGNLEDRLKFLANKMLTPLDIDIKFDIHSDPGRTIPQLVRQNTYLIFKEALNNICKYAEHSVVFINLSLTSAYMEMEIRNQLNNTPNNLETRHSPRKGQGIPNMKLRAQQIKGQLWNGIQDGNYIVHLKAPIKTHKLFF